MDPMGGLTMKRTFGLAMLISFIVEFAPLAQEAKHVKVEVFNLGGGVKLEMVLIPAGKFMMGSPKSEEPRSREETQHEVTISKPFQMGKYEVTQEQWEIVMGGNPSSSKGIRLPVTNVSWNDCQDFIRKLNEKTGSGFRLPTEAEWEYSCRAGTTTAYSHGKSLFRDDANMDGTATKLVGSYKPNGFGLYDMHGNAWEWCNDWHGSYLLSGNTDPKGPPLGRNRILRGGHFGLGLEFGRSAERQGAAPTYKDGGIGFRLARTN